MNASNKLLLKFARKYPWLILLSIALGFSGGMFNGVSTALVIPIILKFVGEGEFLFKKAPPILQKILAFFDVFPEKYKLIAMFGTVVLAIVLKNVANYANTITSSHFARSLVNGMKLEGLKILLDVDLDFYSKNKIGDLSNRLNHELTRTAAAIRVAIGMSTQIITITVFVIFLISISWQLTFISIVLLSLLALTNQYFVNRSKYFGKLLSQKSRAYANKIFEIFTGIRLIKTTSREEDEYLLAKKLIKEREKANFDAQVISALLGPFNEISGIFVIMMMIFLGRYIYANDLKTFSAILLTYLVFLFRLLPLVSKLNRSRSKFANTSHSVGISVDFLNRENKPIMVNGKEEYHYLTKGISLEKLSFAYPGYQNLVLKQINLWIPKGQMTALVGASGAGKSTIADLLPRFYDPIEGRITIDGQDLRDYEIKSLRKSMGIVSQDTFVFNNSVSHNIAYGRENVREEEIIDAAKRANAYEFIMNLPRQFDTEIGDRGVLLSGGQRQRIAIARALLRNPDILILDEATSALDTVSEKLVQEAIDELCKERTTIVIAHRLSTIQKANQIVVLDKGQIVEIGNHEELLQKKGYYSRLYSMQFTDKPQSEFTLSSNKSLLKALFNASNEFRTHLSYEVRTELNTMLGSLRLVNDNLINDPEEEIELIEDSYNSAMRLLNTIEYFEKNNHKLSLED